MLTVPDADRAFYSQGTYDLEYEFPFGIQELEGIAHRGNYDLSQHAKASGKPLEYFDEEAKAKYLPEVVEPSAGVDRTVLALLCEAFAEETVKDEESGKEETRTVLRFAPRMAPIKAGIFPLLKNKPELVAKAKAVQEALRPLMKISYDEAGSIGKRYRRLDEEGTPFGITIDFETLEGAKAGDGKIAAGQMDTVTLRHRDSMKQERIAISELPAYLLRRDQLSAHPGDMKTVHVVFNAHIDPIWLWPWTSGLDALLNTCETMCNLLDRNPDIIFTRGEAWAYAQIEQIDPALFKRIQAHVRAGRWEIVGGWWIQPDCNLPSVEGFRKQIELGRDFFKTRFGQFPTIGYNVDSFGHASILPRLMRECGQTHYVMMRPQEHEKKLPARLFRWRGESGGPVVTTFRIAHGYNIAPLQSDPVKLDWLERAVSELPPGVDDTMCFLGFGDHGGGPSQAMIDWCRANPEPLPGVRLKFSSPSRYFRAVARHDEKLPIVEGDLQYHAIGCYSVYRQVKTEVRRAENLLLQAGEALKADRVLAKESEAAMTSAWKRTCFHHFHDTIGGTCVPSAYPFVFDQLGEACSTGAEIAETVLRRKLAGMTPHVEQRLVLQNNSGAAWDDYVDHEPWLDNVKPEEEWIVRDERGRIVPHQRLLNEAVVNWGDAAITFQAGDCARRTACTSDCEKIRKARIVDSEAAWTHRGRPVHRTG